MMKLNAVCFGGKSTEGSVVFVQERVLREGFNSSRADDDDDDANDDGSFSSLSLACEGQSPE